LAAISLPGLLLIWGVLPFWHQLRGNPAFRRALSGTNAAVVGILLAALYQPIWLSAVTSAVDAAAAIGAFALLAGPRVPPWAAVLICAAAGEAIGRL
jgi:chromate transporter